jgi:cystathionine beta-lyase/cystathionine gamma-synthase
MPRPDDLCPRPDFLPPQPTQPLAPPIFPAAVYQCEAPEQAAAILSGEAQGYVYRRDGHPNADLLAEKCRLLHGAERAVVCGSGMAALSAGVLALLKKDDHIVASSRLYGQSRNLLNNECPRLGIGCTLVDTCDVRATAAAVTPHTKLLVVETITNPLLRVTDIAAMAQIAQRAGAHLLVDNTLAGPTICRPLEWGADLVLESLTKIMNGHSDVLLGVLCGRAAEFERVPSVVTVWGLAASPFECWLAARGLGTLALRAERACENAMRVAEYLTGKPVEAVHYPGLSRHADHELATRQFGQIYGHMVTFTLPGGTKAAESFIRAARRVPFSPSLGDLSTTLSHPESTSHLRLSAEARAEQGIFGGTIRLSIGIESSEGIIEALEEGFGGI